MRLYSILFVPFVLLFQISLATGQPGDNAFFISTNGSDAWSGRLPDPNAEGTDGPFASFDACRASLRALREKGELGPAGVTISVRGGTYRLTSTLVLTAKDSGTEEGPIVWRAYPGERVVLSGGMIVDDFNPVTDPAVRARMSPEGREEILYADLRSLGLTDYGAIEQRGRPGLELFFQNKRMQIARWPNDGWLRIADVPQSGDSLYKEGLAREKRYDDVPAGRHYGRISYTEKRPNRWSRENDVYLHGYWTFDWSDSYQRVESIDTTLSEITIEPSHHHYGYTKNQRYYFLNILEELDRPGEWYLDRSNGLIYFWPPGTIEPGSVSVSVLSDPMVTMSDAAHITFLRFTLACTQGEGIVITGGRDNLVGACTFTNLGDQAVTIEGGINNGVRGCDIFEIALGAIVLQGGDRHELTPAGNFATNNHIHHFSQWLRTGKRAVRIAGVGNIISHNLIHDAPFEAIYLKGNDHLIEYNEIHSVTQETGDAGALHTGRDWTWQGNVIRYNYFHHLLGPGLHGVMGVYLDDWASGFHVYGNLFYRAGRSTLIGGGRDNIVENNIYVECSPSVHIDARGLGWAGYYFDGSRPELFTKMDDMRYSEPPYSERYPELLTIYDGEPAVPKNNSIRRNISYGGRWMDIYDFNAFDFSVVEVRDNVIADSILIRRRKPGAQGWDPYYLNIDLLEGYEFLTMKDSAALSLLHGNHLLESEPEIIEVTSTGPHLRYGPEIDAIRFEKIPVGRIGLQIGPYRRQLPDRTRYRFLRPTPNKDG
ncbi:MAG: right-handed parallel beta-helix repeat-containing protein [Bacteroidota bacterium]